VAAWVYIPNNDKSSLIHQMGSIKGREFVKSKPDINTDDCLFGRHGRDRMVVGFTTTYAICAYHH
jgi:hypothetical protein